MSRPPPSSAREIPKTLLAAGLFLALGASSAAAQAPRFEERFPDSERLSLHLRGGFATGLAVLNDVTDVGESFGAGVGFHIHRQFSIRADGHVNFLDRTSLDGVAFPSLIVQHYTAGLEATFFPGELNRRPLTGAFNLGLGATVMEARDDVSAGAVNEFDATYFTATGGLTAGYQLGPSVNLFVNGQAYLILAEPSETTVFAQHAAGRVEAFDNSWTVPVSMGVKLRIF